MLQGIYTRILVFMATGERGASMVEYGLLVVLIAIVAFTAVSFAGDQVSETYSEINSGLEWANSHATP